MTSADRALPSPAARRSIARALGAWFRAARRELPFRKDRDAYSVWVSELMLQQTRVATVVPYFERWMARFPDVTALARATEDEVLHAFQGLGYYSRARNLHRGAQVVVERHGGELPRGVAALRALPGVGAYTAGAIASIAQGERVPIVDGNVIRVLTRLFALGGDPTRPPLARRLWELAGALVPADAPGEFNEALMELGATVCTPRAPRCADCPLRRRCVARATGRTAELPVLPPREPVTKVARAAARTASRGGLLVVRVPADAPRWAGLWELPTADLSPGESPEQAAVRALREATGLRGRAGERLGTLQHSVTRFRVSLTVVDVTAAGAPRAPTREWRWVDDAALAALAMPAAQRRATALGRDAGPERRAARRSRPGQTVAASSFSGSTPSSASARATSSAPTCPSRQSASSVATTTLSASTSK